MCQHKNPWCQKETFKPTVSRAGRSRRWSLRQLLFTFRRSGGHFLWASLGGHFHFPGMSILGQLPPLCRLNMIENLLSDLTSEVGEHRFGALSVARIRREHRVKPRSFGGVFRVCLQQRLIRASMTHVPSISFREILLLGYYHYSTHFYPANDFGDFLPGFFFFKLHIQLLPSRLTTARLSMVKRCEEFWPRRWPGAAFVHP